MQLSTVEKPVVRSYFSVHLIACAVFVPTGMVTVLLGPMLPLLGTKWSLNDTQAGYLITAQFLGALLGTVSSSPLVPHLGFRMSMIAGQVLMALGTVTLFSNSFAIGVAAIFCYGIGLGLTIPVANLMVAEASTQWRSSALNLLNFSWSAGAVSCPFLLAAFQRTHGTQFFLYAVGLFLVLTAALTARSGVSPAQAHAERAPVTMRPSYLLHLRNPVAIMLGALFFLYVGTENALGAWLASYAKRTSEASVVAWMSVPSYFYSAILLGRALAPLSVRRLGDVKQACFGVLLAGLSSLLLILSRSISAIAICALFAGLGLSTVYPITIAFLSASFGAQASRIGGALFALSSLGGASVPWLVGFVSTQSRSLRTALIVPLFGCLAMLVIFARPQWNHLGTEASS